MSHQEQEEADMQAWHNMKQLEEKWLLDEKSQIEYLEWLQKDGKRNEKRRDTRSINAPF